MSARQVREPMWGTRVFKIMLSSFPTETLGGSEPFINHSSYLQKSGGSFCVYENGIEELGKTQASHQSPHSCSPAAVGLPGLLKPSTSLRRCASVCV